MRTVKAWFGDGSYTMYQSDKRPCEIVAELRLNAKEHGTSLLRCSIIKPKAVTTCETL